ncbi:YaaL family protein [Alteribacter aurantiacus]|uniref:YaaL family protein n=1 Tax=Alteribacter aurantiacus TaxID=254410 RepID=UPI000425FEBE|nr:YaaL family protein [Alteribacter aurantiacus]
MFFRKKKRKVRRQGDERLLEEIDTLKDSLDQQRSMLAHSSDYQDHLQYQSKLTEAKYLFLLKEVRKRRASKMK